MQPARMQISDGQRRVRGQFAFDLQTGLLRVGALYLRIDSSEARQKASRKRRGDIREDRRARLAEAELRDPVFRAVALQRVRCRAQRDAVEIYAVARADDRLAIARRPCEPDARR